METGEKGEGEGSGAASERDPEDADQAAAAAALAATLGLTRLELEELRSTIKEHHSYHVSPVQCSSRLSQRVRAPAGAVWSVVRRFDRPQVYKHFIRSCSLRTDGVDSGRGGEIRVGCLRDVSVTSGLPANTSTERLDVLDEERHVSGFSIIGGEHRLRNYRSVTTVNEFRRTSDGSDEVGDRGGDGEDDDLWSVVLESYVVDVPEGNTVEDTRLFADTVVRLNLQKLASVAEAIVAGGGRGGGGGGEQLHHHQRPKRKIKRGGN